jgi:L-fuculose-phosphate aldolase
MATTEKAVRESIIAPGATVVAAGLGGTLVGDISARFEDSLLITPSGANYADLRAAMIARMPLVGEYGAWKGPMKPTGEWRIHLDIVRARPDIGGIVRFLSPYATALAMAGKPIPAAHSMIALFGAPIVRCAKYAPAGTKELASLALEALDQSHAVLLSNYCALTTGLNAGNRAGPGARTRNARPALRNCSFAWSAGHTCGSGSRSDRRALEVKRRRCSGAPRSAC